MQEFDVNIRATDVTPLSEPPAPQPLRCALLAGALASVGAAGLLEANGPLGAASRVREQKEVGALGRGGGWAACIGGEGSPFAPPDKAQAAPRKGRGRRRVRRGGGAGAEVTVPALGGAQGAVWGSRARGWEGESGARAAARGGEQARGRGGRGGAEAAGPGIRSPGARPALRAEPRLPPARSRLGPKLLGVPRSTEERAAHDDRRRGPSPAPWAQGLPLRGAGSARDFPAGRARGPGRRAGSPPGDRGERGLRGPGPPRRGNALPAEAGPAPGGRQTPRRDPQSGARPAADEESGAAARAARALRGAGRAPRRSQAPPGAPPPAVAPRGPSAAVAGGTGARGPDKRRDMQVSARLSTAGKGRSRAVAAPGPWPRCLEAPLLGSASETS